MKYELKNKWAIINKLRKLDYSFIFNERGQFTVEASLIFTFIVLLVVISLSFMGMTYQKGKLILIAHETLYKRQDKEITLETDWKHFASEDQTVIKVSREQHRPNFRLKLFEFKSAGELVGELVEALEDE
tara:strand:- start:18 stop:407 length:390 start_codon:yes stop_codon:yes gene_type:complete